MRALFAAAALLCAAALPAAAQGPGSLEAARAAFEQGDFDTAARLSAAALAGDLSRPDRVEAWRVRGLALFYAGRPAEAGPAILEYLKLDVDARLDPAFHTPEAIAFFEQVRSENAELLAAYRPEPDRRRLVVALLPPFAQFQNHQPLKGWIFAGVEGTLLVANVTALVIQLRTCDVFGDKTCSDKDRATTTRRVLMATGWALAGVVALGIVDGLHGYNKWRRRRDAMDTMSFDLAPQRHGVAARVGWRF